MNKISKIVKILHDKSLQIGKIDIPSFQKFPIWFILYFEKSKFYRQKHNK